MNLSDLFFIRIQLILSQAIKKICENPCQSVVKNVLCNLETIPDV